jgi:hypothetical protein
MLSWAQRVTAPPPGAAPEGDLLELYCGNGNFTVGAPPLSVSPGARTACKATHSASTVMAIERQP